MKRIIVALMCVVLTLCFAGCASKEEQYNKLKKETTILWDNTRRASPDAYDGSSLYAVGGDNSVVVTRDISEKRYKNFLAHYDVMMKNKDEILERIQKMRKLAEGDVVLTNDFKKVFDGDDKEYVYKILPDVKKKIEYNYKNPKKEMTAEEFARMRGFLK